MPGTWMPCGNFSTARRAITDRSACRKDRLNGRRSTGPQDTREGASGDGGAHRRELTLLPEPAHDKPGRIVRLPGSGGLLDGLPPEFVRPGTTRCTRCPTR
jgi:hypothetical protein